MRNQALLCTHVSSRRGIGESITVHLYHSVKNGAVVKAVIGVCVTVADHVLTSTGNESSSKSVVYNINI